MKTLIQQANSADNHLVGEYLSFFGCSYFPPQMSNLAGACHSEFLGPYPSEVKVTNMAASIQRSFLLKKLLFNSSFRPALLSSRRSLEVCI